MTRQLTVPLDAVWLAAVVAAWLVTMPLLALLISVTGPGRSAGSLVGLAALSATFACVVVGGPIVAVALRVRRNCNWQRAVLSGLATGGLVVLFFYSYAVAAGAPVPGAWKALPPLILVTGAELALALGLRRCCREEDPPVASSSKAQAYRLRPDHTEPDQPEASA